MANNYPQLWNDTCQLSTEIEAIGLSLPKVRTPSVFKIAKEVHNLARQCVGFGNLNSSPEHKSGSSARLSNSYYSPT